MWDELVLPLDVVGQGLEGLGGTFWTPPLRFSCLLPDSLTN